MAAAPAIVRPGSYVVQEMMQMSAQEKLEREHPERIPATSRTRYRMPLALRVYYQHRPITELAARCLLNEALRTAVDGTKSAMSEERYRESVEFEGRGRRRIW